MPAMDLEKHAVLELQNVVDNRLENVVELFE